MALDTHCPLQNVPYPNLAAELKAAGQVISAASRANKGVRGNS
jgi:hypothetical protein